jgi:predicted ATP-grasp superfamily ATP-dependent carboligase
MDYISPNVLIISNLHDYSTDHVVYQLNKMEIPYLRLNRDQFSGYKIYLNPESNTLSGFTKEFQFEIEPESLNSIYFRAPIYLRANPRTILPVEEQLSRSQWASFLRSLVIFEDVLWVNDPKATYNAETKPYQLKIAKKIGFNIPKTLITNSIPSKNFFGEKIVVKTLDPAIFNLGDQESFIYSNIIYFEELSNSDLSSSPIILQEALIPKIDVRVTVVKNFVFAVTIKKGDKGIDMDWRLEKDNLEYDVIELPSKIRDKCIRLLKELELNFGCIDLIIHNGNYYFIEINPTGEWDWLMHNLNLNIDKKIAKLLTG